MKNPLFSLSKEQREFFDEAQDIFLAQNGFKFNETGAKFFETASGGVIATTTEYGKSKPELQILGFSETSWDHPSIAPSFFCFRINLNLEEYDPTDKAQKIHAAPEKIRFEANLSHEVPDLTTIFITFEPTQIPPWEIMDK